MSKQTKDIMEFDSGDSGADDSPLTKSLKTSAEPEPVPTPALPAESEDAFYLNQYLNGFSAEVSLPFKSNLNVKPINSHIVEGMKTLEGQQMIISTAGCFDINGLKLSFKYVRTGQNARLAIDNGWVFVRRDDVISGMKFSDMLEASAFNPESGCVTEGGSINHATGRAYGEELILCARPFASYVAQHKAQAIISSRRLGAVGVDESDSQGADRVNELVASRGVPDGAVRPMVTSKGWSGVGRASMTKDN